MLRAKQQIIEHGIFHGIGAYGHRKTRASTGLRRAIDNRVGVTGTGRQCLALAGNSRHITLYLRQSGKQGTVGS